MLRLIGACMVIFGCGTAGIVVARSYSLRPRHLQEMRSALQLLATEINYARSSLSEACSKIAGQVEGPIAQFFAQFADSLAQNNDVSASELWNQTLQILGEAGFTNQELEAVGQLGSALGRSDADDQMKHLLLLQTRLEQLGSQAEQERDKMVRLWNYLGFCVGALIVLLLI